MSFEEVELFSSHEGLRRLYLYLDMRDHDNTVIAYNNIDGAFIVACAGDFAKGAQPCIKSQGICIPSNNMCGRPVHM